MVGKKKYIYIYIYMKKNIMIKWNFGGRYQWMVIGYF